MKQRLVVQAMVMAAVSVSTMAVAQTALPVPFSSVVAGIAPAGTVTACGTTPIPTAASVSLAGDGCLATQATLNGPYGTNVDSLGNIYIGDYNNFALRVVYMGGTGLAAAIQAANPTQTIVPKVGYMYTLAGSRQAAIATSQGTTGSKQYYCNGAGSGLVGLGSNGDNCPATYGYIKPRSPYIDGNGNVFFTSGSGGAPIRVVYVGGTAVANLIQTLDGVTPQVGFIYSIVKSAANGYAGDGSLSTATAVQTYTPRDMAIDSKGNIYMSDGTNSFTAPAYGSNNNIRRIDGVTGIITTYAGSPGCAQPSTSGCPGVFGGDNGPATSATFNSPYTIFFDRYDNLYITSYNDNRLRVVYQGGTVAGLSNLTAGNVYTVAGGGALTASGSPATSLSVGNMYTAGVDPAGNIYFYDPTAKFVWRVDAATGIANSIIGNKTLTAGAYCIGSSGPKATDKLGDGCPGPQSSLAASGKFAFDKLGNFYYTENTNAVVRQYSYNTQLPPTSVGGTVTQPVAFSMLATQTLTAESFSVDGGATGEFSDGGGNTCALNTSVAAAAVCVFNVKFAPTQAGLRRGSLQLATATGTAASIYVGGTGVAANTSIDPASTSSLGSGFTPIEMIADSNGSVYVADSAGNKVVKISSGGTLSTLMSGLNKPSQVAVDGAGNVYVADAGNNRVAKVSAAGGTVVALGTGLSNPQGVVADSSGNVYVADTGNNRVVELTYNGGQQAVNLFGLSAPTKLAIDAVGNLFVIDSGNNRVVELPVASEQVAINLGTTAITPVGIAVDSADDLYLADSSSQSVVEFAPGVTNGNALVTGLGAPKGVAVDLNGTLYVADSSTTSVLVANRTQPLTGFPNTNLNTTNSDALNITNTGNALLLFNGAQLTTATGDTAVFSVTSSTTNGCALGVAIAPGVACGLTANFTPVAKQAYAETVTLGTNAANAGASKALLTGTGVFLVTTSTAIKITSPTTSTINYAQPVTVSITITAASNAGAAPSGTVKISVDGKLQTQALPASGVVSVTLNPAVGTHVISASYGGDTLYASSSSSFSFTVLKAVTATTLAIGVGQQGSVPTLTFTATVSSATANGETGTVSFYSGSTLIGTGTVNTSGVATFTTQTTVYASYSFTAVYSGDVNFAGSTSVVLAPKGDFTIVPANLTVSTPQGGNATLNNSITPLYNYSGSLTATCSGLPANSLCRFQPTTLVLSGTSTQSFAVIIYTNVDPTLASLEPLKLREQHESAYMAMVGGPFAMGLLLMMRRRKGLISRLSVVLVVVMSCGLMAMSGCSGKQPSASNFVTPQGTSTVAVTYSDGAGVSHTVNYAFTVSAPYSLP